MSRQQVYTLLIAISAAIMLGRILAVDRVDYQQLQAVKLRQAPKILEEKRQRLIEQGASEASIEAELDKTWNKLMHDAYYETPFLSGNDRSRWDTIRVLVEPEMRVIRTLKAKDGTEYRRYVWYAIDKVQNLKGWDTIDMVQHALPDQPVDENGKPVKYLYSSKPPLLPTVMAIPYAAIYWGSGQRFTLENDPYLIVRTTLILFNLIPLVYCWVLLARMIEYFGKTDWGRIYTVAFVCFGTFLSTFVNTLNNHLPAVFCITVASYCAFRVFFCEERRLRYFFGAGFFGSFVVACELPALSFCALLGLIFLLKFPRQTLLASVPAALIVAAAFLTTNYIAHRTAVPAYGQQDWYFFEYERGGRTLQSYWYEPVGIDRGEPSRLLYIVHSTIGHHGLFLLTPVWILSFYGLGIWLRKTSDPRLRIAAAGILLMSLVVFSFYMAMKQPNRNYGGMSSALRWMFWFVPLWSVPLVAAADRLGEQIKTRRGAIGLLAISVMSATYPIWNPWTQPWPYYLMVYLGIPAI